MATSTRATTRLVTATRNLCQRFRASELQDDVWKQRFFIKLDPTLEAVVDYERKGNVYDLIHTEIPKEYHGKGLGSILAEKVFNHLIAQNKKLKLTCEFLQSYYQRNEAKYKDHIVAE